MKICNLQQPFEIIIVFFFCLCANFVFYYVESVCQLQTFLVECLGSFTYKVILPTNKDTLASFPILSLGLHQCLIVLAKTSSTILNRNGETRQSCLIPDFSGNALSFCSFKLTFGYELIVNCQYQAPITCLVSRTFIIKGC